MGIVIAVLEMPFICFCDPCKKISNSLHAFEDYRLRGLAYLVLAALGCFVNFQMGWAERVRDFIKRHQDTNIRKCREAGP